MKIALGVCTYNTSTVCTLLCNKTIYRVWFPPPCLISPGCAAAHGGMKKRIRKGDCVAFGRLQPSGKIPPPAGGLRVETHPLGWGRLRYCVANGTRSSGSTWRGVHTFRRIRLPSSPRNIFVTFYRRRKGRYAVGVRLPPPSSSNVLLRGRHYVCFYILNILKMNSQRITIFNQ